MRLTQQTSYSVQTLMYCAVNETGPSRIRDIARAYRISELHLFKIMRVLVENRLVDTLRGRNGGIRLARPADQITLGEVVRAAEGSLQLNECLSHEGHECPIGASCGFGPALHDALVAFFEVLDRYTIADVVARPALAAALVGAKPDESDDSEALLTPKPA